MSRGLGVTEVLTGLLPEWALPIVLLATMLAEAPIIVAVIVARFWFVDRRTGMRLVAIATVALALVLAFKHVLQFPRPPASVRVPVADVAAPFDGIYRSLLDTDESGFPSGHTTIAAAVYGGAALDAATDDREKWLGVAVVLTLLVGGSRVFLGVHYVVDLAGGVLLAAGVVLATRTVDARLDAPDGSLTVGVVGLAGAVAVVPWTSDVAAPVGAFVGAAIAWVALDVPVDGWATDRHAESDPAPTARSTESDPATTARPAESSQAPIASPAGWSSRGVLGRVVGALAVTALSVVAVRAVATDPSTSTFAIAAVSASAVVAVTALPTD